MSRIAVLATLDTKAEETGYLAGRIRGLGDQPVLFDTGLLGTGLPGSAATRADYGRAEIWHRAGHDGAGDVDKLTAMRLTVDGTLAILSDLVRGGQVHAAVAIGGGQGSWLAGSVFRQLPLGFPRLLVTTAGRDAGQYTQFSDIFSVFSITDVAGLNPLLCRVLDNAAAAVHGLARNRDWSAPLPGGLVAMSVYGITSAGARSCLTRLRALGMLPVTFHANGVGGATMEEQLSAADFAGVLDWSTTEIADEVVGGICSAGPSRLTTAGRRGLPQLAVPGGIDVVNFGAPDTIPAEYTGRRTYAHTPDATLLRTNPEENAAIAAVMADRLNAASGPVVVVIPERGFSALSGPGDPLADPEADAAFLAAITTHLRHDISVDVVDAAINDETFAGFVAERFAKLLDR